MAELFTLRAVEYVTPLPSAEDTVSIIEDGAQVQGQEVCNERLHVIPEECLSGTPLVLSVSPNCFMIELSCPEGYGFTHAATSTRALDCSGPFPMLIFPHPGEKLKVTIASLSFGN
jgi:hypothetical protein